jgi:hypothetical protein
LFEEKGRSYAKTNNLFNLSEKIVCQLDKEILLEVMDKQEYLYNKDKKRQLPKFSGSCLF